MKRLSIKAKVTAWIATFTILISALALVVILQFLNSTVWTEAENEIREGVEEFAEEIEIFPDGSYVIDEDSYHEDQIIFSIYDNQGALIAGSIPSSFPTDTILKNGIVQTVKVGEKQWMTYDAAIGTGNGEYLWVRGIYYTGIISSAETGIMFAALILFPLLILLAAIGGYLITKRAFAPVEDICRTAAEISNSGDLSRRVELEGSGNELHKLAGIFNHMLDSVEAAFESEKQFTADASHELRTPISVILSESEYGLLSDVTEEEKKDVLEVILGQAKKMTAIISQMLIIARNERQKQILEPVDLSMAAQIASEDLAEKASKKKITIDVQSEAGVLVLGEQTSILRICNNLIENAVKYGTEGGHVWVKVYKEANHANFSVKDDGIGIAKEHHEKIFHRFYRVDKARTADDETHTGLGLSMVKMLVENVKGTISVQSELGKGTEFAIRIPVIEDLEK